MAKDTRDWGSYESDPELNRRIREHLRRGNSGTRVNDAGEYMKRIKRKAYLEETCNEEAIRQLISTDRNYDFLINPPAEKLREEFEALRRAGARIPFVDYEVMYPDTIAQKYLDFIKKLRALPV